MGTKSRLLRKHYPDCWIPELPPDIYRRIEIVEAEMAGPKVITGSSLGGLTGVMYAMKHPEMVGGLVLFAPAVGSRDGISIMADEEKGLLNSLYIPKNIPTAIIAGIRDELIPVSAIRNLVQRSPEPEKIILHEVDDDHMLHQSLDLILETIKEVL
jgi:pimeloyl-ACP methyl ester carboxylesterase